MNVVWKMLLTYFVTWWGAATIVDTVLLLNSEIFTVFDAGLVIAGCISASFVSQICGFYILKKIFTPVRRAIAEYIPDPAERDSLVTTMSMQRKLVFSTAGLISCSVAFGVALAQKEAMRNSEHHSLVQQQKILEEVETRFNDGDLVSQILDDLLRSSFTGQYSYLIMDGNGEVLPDPFGLPRPSELSPLFAEELEIIHRAAAKADRGDSSRYDMQHFYSWVRLAPEGPLMVMHIRAIDAGGDIATVRVDFASLIFVVLLVSGLAAWFLAADVSESVAELSKELEKLAAGDLSTRSKFESEDEMGRLGRLIDSTTISLRATVSQVTQAASGIDQTVHQISEVVDDVRLATQGQGESVREATAALQGIDENVHEIAGSARALASSSEESSRTVSELGIAGDQLNRDAQSFAQRVEHVSVSVEGMVGMIEQVAGGTEELASAADETSSSMEQSVASIRAMEVNVGQTARLSEEVVQSAEGGHRRVNETIEGIEKIREATNTAQSVIRSLGEQAGEIGSILNVITDVADETNLLALNASIIAAQAGENGKAFSVVADEINELADRVLQHTKEIAKVIHGLQSLSEDAIAAIETGTQSVSMGVEKSAEAGEALATIMQTTREAGQRTGNILSSVEEQTISAKRNLELMAHVRDQVDLIRVAEREQTASTQAIRQDAVEMTELSRNISQSVDGHARATLQIQETIESVSAATGQIDHALEEQTEACGRVVDFMAAVHDRTHSNEQSVVRLQETMQALLEQAATLRTNVANFKLDDDKS
ncbi:MAG: hypothetical protein JRC77_01825 [Deltaproteobacteria bacterium]|nr:hypothetical protein [Deltaproteobacteria bacterium]